MVWPPRYITNFPLNDDVSLEFAAINKEEIFVFRYVDKKLNFDTHFFANFREPGPDADPEQMYISSFGPLKFGTYPYPSNRKIHRSEIEIVKNNIVKILQSELIQRLFRGKFPKKIYFNPEAFSRIEDK